MDLSHEEFWLILMKRNNEVIKKEMISRGGMSGTLVDAKVIFKRALEECASGIVLAHNHPSGNLKTLPTRYQSHQKNEGSREKPGHLYFRSSDYHRSWILQLCR